jgi:hypothetical protein
MIENIVVYKTKNGYATIAPLNVKREWMDETAEGHAYKCFPVSLANGLGWGISFPEDITFIWDGITDTTPDHIKIITGEKYIYPDRGNATVSFTTGLMFKTPQNYTLLAMPVPNQHTVGVSPFTTLISTSFYNSDLPCAWRITEANKEITIKAGTPVMAVLPISLTNLQNTEIHMKRFSNIPISYHEDYIGYHEVINHINQSGKWADFYRNGVNHEGKTVGEHEVKLIRLKVIEGE